MNGPLWKGARQLLLQPRTLQADLSCSGDTKGWYLDPSLGERPSPIPALAPGRRTVCRLPPELAQPHKVTSILSRPLPAPLPACGFISIWTDGRGGPSIRCFPSAGAVGRRGHLLPPPPTLHFWWELQGSREHLSKNPDNLLAPRAGLPGLP